MADNVRVSLRREIDRLQRAVARKSTELKSLNDNLKRHQGALELLGNGARGAGLARRKSRKMGKSALIDWNAVLERLPNSFTLKQFISRSEFKGKSPVYLRQIAANWVKRGKTKRLSPGKYQKAEQKKTRAA